LGHFGVFLCIFRYFGVYLTNVCQRSSLFVFWDGDHVHLRLRLFCCHLGSFVNVNVRPNVNIDININVNVRPNLAVWMNKRSSMFANEDRSIKYVNKQTNYRYINKQTKAKAGSTPKSIKICINMKTRFKNIFHNLIQNIISLIICITLLTRRCYLLKL